LRITRKNNANILRGLMQILSVFAIINLDFDLIFFWRNFEAITIDLEIKIKINKIK